MRAITTSTYQTSLANIARLYAGIGQSVIPIYGDTMPDRAKVSAVNWKIFQMRIAPGRLIDHWFEAKKFGGVGIVTGRISNLVVIDFDSEACEVDFKQRFPHLTQTRIIQSAGRGLSHYYYHMPQDINLPTLHMEGADLLSNGAYAIAPPTMIDGKSYEIVEGGRAYELTKRDADRLLDFFGTRNDRYTTGQDGSFSIVTPTLISRNDRYAQPSSRSHDTKIDTSPENDHRSFFVSSESLVHLYQHYAPQMGRNNALFKVACHGRDHQLSKLDVSNVLKGLHAEQLPINGGQQESHQARLREAERTIASAFSHPPRSPIQQEGGIQLTNSIREALLKRGLTCVARVLDGLFLHGFKPGDIITKKIVTDTLKGQVGRHSILKSFSAMLDDNQSIFQVIDPPPRTPSYTSVAKHRLKESNKKCFLFSVSKPDKISGGRTATQFQLPDLNVLCQLLGVPFTRSDPLTKTDIQQANRYRQAVHRELIKRRPGMYYRQWLASRIGVSRRTSQRYDHDAEIQRQAMIIREPITWDNMAMIPMDEPIDGRFIEGKGGKRYPPLRLIAKRLLAQKQTITYCYQDANYYWYGDNLPLISVRYGVNPKQAEYDEQLERLNANLRGYWADFKAKKHVKDITPADRSTSRQQSIITQLEPPELIDRPTDKPYQPKSKRFYKKPLSDGRAESLAQRLYQAIWDRASSEKSRLSLANARRLIDQYSEKLIHRALGILKYRQNISNPAGFIIVWLRSTAKAY